MTTILVSSVVPTSLAQLYTKNYECIDEGQVFCVGSSATNSDCDLDTQVVCYMFRESPVMLDDG